MLLFVYYIYILCWLMLITISSSTILDLSPCFHQFVSFNMSALAMQRWTWWKVLEFSGFVDSLVDGCYSSHRTLCLVSRYETWQVDSFRYFNRFVVWFAFSLFGNVTWNHFCVFSFAPMKNCWSKFQLKEYHLHLFMGRGFYWFGHHGHHLWHHSCHHRRSHLWCFFISRND